MCAKLLTGGIPLLVENALQESLFLNFNWISAYTHQFAGLNSMMTGLIDIIPGYKGNFF